MIVPHNAGARFAGDGDGTITATGLVIPWWMVVAAAAGVYLIYFRRPAKREKE